MQTPAIKRRFQQERIELGLENPRGRKAVPAATKGGGGADISAAVAAKAATTPVEAETPKVVA